MFVLIAFTNGASCLAMAIIGRGDVVQFNHVAIIYHFILFGTEVAFSAVVCRHGQQLQELIVSSNNMISNSETRKNELVYKIRALQLGSLSLPGGQLPMVLMAFLEIFLGSAPYIWIVSMIVSNGMATPAITMTTLAIFKDGESSSNKMRASKDFSKGTGSKDGTVVNPGSITVVASNPLNEAISTASFPSPSSPKGDKGDRSVYTSQQ